MCPSHSSQLPFRNTPNHAMQTLMACPLDDLPETSVALHSSEFVPGVDYDQRSEIHAASLRVIAFFLFLVLLSSSAREDRWHVGHPSRSCWVRKSRPSPLSSLQCCWWLRKTHAQYFYEYVERNRKSSHTFFSLTHASYGYDYKLLPFSVSGTIYHLWDLWDHFLQCLRPCLHWKCQAALHFTLYLI